jgi:WD40 repeat protein
MSSAISVAFSQDSSYVASGAAFSVIRIWDIRSGKEVRTIRTNRPPHSLRFGTSTGSMIQLHTNVGIIYAKLSTITSHVGNCVSDLTSLAIRSNNQTSSSQGSALDGAESEWGLNGDGSWITWRGRGAIWLPPGFRSTQSDFSTDGATIAIGCSTGRVVVIRMSLHLPFSDIGS